MNLIKTSALNSIAVIIKMATMLVLNKVLAYLIGPTGYVSIGNFQNAIQMITKLGSGAINTGVVKYTAEYYNEEGKQRLLWRTAGSITAILSLVASLLILLFNRSLSIWFLKDEQYSIVFIWLSISLFFLTLNSLLLAILNGKKEIKKYITINIFGSLFSLIVTVFMTYFIGLKGALIAMAINQSLACIVSIALFSKIKWFKLSFLYGKIDLPTTTKLSKFALMAMVTAICMPGSQILIRNHLGVTFGLELAGYWEAMWRVSKAYLLFITSTFAVYYLPRLSEIKEVVELKKEISQGYKILLPIAICFSLSIFLLKDFIIQILFTPDFLPMSELFGWQMVGDTMKIGSFILAYLMLSKALTKVFVITEIVFSCSLVLFTYFFTSLYGIKGCVMAYAFNYGIYWLVMYFVIKVKVLDQKQSF